MSNSVKIEHILSEIKQLDYETKMSLLERINMLVKSDVQKSKSNVRLIELKGLGSEIWSNVNIDNYIKQERQWE